MNPPIEFTRGNHQARIAIPVSVAEPESLKEIAGIAACDFVSSGMSIGLGTGSTVKYSIIELSRRINHEGLEIVGVPTSEETRKLAESLGIKLQEIHDTGGLDLTIDGADEFDPNFDLIKGGGGALTREKIVAKMSRAMVVVADERKKVEKLGSFPLPIEVKQSSLFDSRDQLSSICPGPVEIRGGDEEPYLTDNSGNILDCHFGATISEPLKLESRIKSISGIVEVGLFVGICDAVVLASGQGVSTFIKPGGRLD